MTLIQYILAILPAIFICLYVIRSDKYEPEPLSALLFSFVLGALLIIPTVALGRLIAWNSSTVGQTFYQCFVQVAFVEEGLKLALLLLLFYKRPFFNEPLDGIIYAVMIGMGFATAENLLFAGKHPWFFYVQRACTAQLAHGAFSIIQGFYVGQARFAANKHKRYRYLIIAFITSCTLHGSYDLFLQLSPLNWVTLFSIIILFISAILAYRFIHIQAAKPPVKL